MAVEILSGGDEQTDELLLTDTLAATEGVDTLPATEPLDELEYPDTLDDDTVEETPLIKQLREQRKADAREKREMAKRLAELEGKTAPQSLPEPDLWEDCEGDPDKYKAALLKWQANEQAVTEHASARPAEQIRAAQEWQNDLQAYKAKAIALAKPDFQAAEDAVVSTLTDAQQNTIVMAAKDPARFIYALGRSPQRLAMLAEITNPIKLAAEVARIEGTATVVRKAPANIDEPVRGSARLSGTPKNAEEDKLIAEAQRTGDATNLREYRRAQKAAA